MQAEATGWRPERYWALGALDNTFQHKAPQAASIAVEQWSKVGSMSLGPGSSRSGTNYEPA